MRQKRNHEIYFFEKIHVIFTISKIMKKSWNLKENCISFLNYSCFRTKDVFKIVNFCPVAQFPQNLNENSESTSYICASTLKVHGTAKIVFFSVLKNWHKFSKRVIFQKFFFCWIPFVKTLPKMQ